MSGALILAAAIVSADSGLYRPASSKLCAVEQGRNLWCFERPTIEQEALAAEVYRRLQARWKTREPEPGEFEREATVLRDRLLALRGRTLEVR